MASFSGSVGITLDDVSIDKGEYTNHYPSQSMKSDVDDLLNPSVSPNTLLGKIELASKLKALEIKSNIDNTKSIVDSNHLISKVLTTLVNNGRNSTVYKETVELAYSDATLTQSIDLNTNITSLIEEVKKLIPGKDANGNVIGSSIDVTPLIEVLNERNINQIKTNSKIIDGLTSQIETNNKLVEVLEKQKIDLDSKKEYYDFKKDGISTLKDSTGNVIKPREVEALNNAEKLIDQKEENETTLNDYMDYASGFFSTTLDSTSDVLGATDGFSLEFNPFKFLDDVLVDDYMTNKDDLKGKI